jgi:ADP-ribosylglycohydrolase
MRVAPVGAFFAGDPERASKEARLSAVVTHAHPEGQAGAVAAAVAASMAACDDRPAGREFIEEVVRHVPDGITRQRLLLARDIPAGEHGRAVRILGTGSRVSAQDTVPFCVWVAAHHLGSYEEALWQTAKGQGDCDTTCAIVGGIVSLSAALPLSWLERREPLPSLEGPEETP